MALSVTIFPQGRDCWKQGTEELLWWEEAACRFGGCGGSGSEVVARTEKLGWRRRWRLPGLWFPQEGTRLLGMEGGWRTKVNVNVFPSVVLSASSYWINWHRNNSLSLIICLCIIAMMALDGSEYPVYGSMSFICFSILIKIWDLANLVLLEFLTCSAWAVLWLGWDYMGGMTWPHSLHPLGWFGLGLVGYGFIPCDLGLSWIGFGRKLGLIPYPPTLNFQIPTSVISTSANW